MIKGLTALAILLAPMPAAAREWPTAGGWTIVEIDDEACIMGMEYDGEGATMLGLVLDTKGQVLVTAANYNWSAKKGQAYDLVYLLDGINYSGGASVGTETGARKGFVTSFKPDFLGHFAKSSGIAIESKEGVVIDDLSLQGSAAALVVLKRCVAHVKAAAEAEAREKARFAHIPKDPFANVPGAPINPPASGSEPAAAAHSPVNLASLISNADYPAAALRAGEEGTTGFRLDVGADGRVAACTVTASSGSASLDAATCRILRSRARFTPARDADGNPTTDSFDAQLTWSITP